MERRLMHAKSKVRSLLLSPVEELIAATTDAIAAAEQRAADAEAALEELRPVWAQGFTTDSEAAQANGNALAELWAALGVDNQTAAMQRVHKLIEEETTK